MDPRDVQSIPLFAGLSKDDQKVVAQYADEVDVGPGTMLAEEGRLAYEFFAIKAGTAEVKLGGQHTAALGPGDFFGEIGLLAGDRRVASVVATSPMSLVVLTGSRSASASRPTNALSSLTQKPRPASWGVSSGVMSAAHTR